VAKVKVGDYEADIFYDRTSDEFKLGVSIDNSPTVIHVPLQLGPTIQKLKEAIDDVHRTQSH
jgi:hypothetical protein